MPSFNYKTSPFIYYPESITVDTHDCTVEDIPENERPIKGMTKCLRCIANSEKTQYIDFGEITIFRDKDFSIDFWYNVTSNDFSRVLDFTLNKNTGGISFSSNGESGKPFPTLGEGQTWSPRRDYWNHFCWQYHSNIKIQRLILNGKIEKENTLDIQDTVFPYTYLGRSAHDQDPAINCRYTGIRIQYGLVFNNLDARSLKYFNYTMSNLKTY